MFGFFEAYVDSLGIGLFCCAAEAAVAPPGFPDFL